MSSLFSAQGRIRRSEWWLFTIGLGILSVVLTFGITGLVIGWDDLASSVEPGADWRALAIRYGIALLFLWPLMAVSLRRAHDRNGSGWVVVLAWVLNLGGEIAAFFVTPGSSEELLVFPVYLVSGVLGLFLLITLGFLDGTQGPNRYGPSPKGAGSRNYQAPTA
ncbi:DUF805 domain-containing protein [Brevundimonas sp.]|jgi:uncharacterized membrane protein YhaH (DUF805 family)|uniref:DUF805 domain-containing protein n=1 Tax=Brevundimonas sp. TaxID=1871086 RepID=UPI0037835357